jgi:hypothetical protein
MAYELRYTISQALRDGTTLTANIYEKDYVGDVITYEAINISLESNASNDEPLAGIISSQLNISFITTEENGFPIQEITIKYGFAYLAKDIYYLNTENEPILDAWIDLVNYSIIAQLVSTNKWKK